MRCGKAVLVSKRGITVRKSSIKITIAFCCMGLLAGVAAAQQPYTTWHTFGGTASDTNYSALSQINRSNVTKLQVAWKYDTGDQAAYQLAPIVVDRTLYGAAKNGSLVAIERPRPTARKSGYTVFPRMAVAAVSAGEVVSPPIAA